MPHGVLLHPATSVSCLFRHIGLGWSRGHVAQVFAGSDMSQQTQIECFVFRQTARIIVLRRIGVALHCFRLAPDRTEHGTVELKRSRGVAFALRAPCECFFALSAAVPANRQAELSKFPEASLPAALNRLLRTSPPSKPWVVGWDGGVANRPTSLAAGRNHSSRQKIEAQIRRHATS